MIWWMLQNFTVTAVLAGCVWMICRIVRPGPAMQHALWLVILVKLVTPPLLPWPWAVEDLVNRAGLKETIARNSLIAAEPEQVARGTASKANNVDVPGRNTEAAIPPGELLLLVVASVWLTGSGLFIVVQAEKLRLILALLRGARPASLALESLVEDVAGHLRIRPIAARVAATIASPFVWCVGRPVLLWPEALPPGDGSVRGLLVHELAHVKRRDHWVGWLELAAGCLWWWNPLYWYIRRQLRENAELACDAWVVSSMESAPHGRRAYAEALLSVCESISAESQQSSPSLAMGVNTGDRRFLERRLTMILRDHRPFRLSRIGIVFIAFVFAGTVPAWTMRAAPEPAPSVRATTPQRIPPQVEEAVRQVEKEILPVTVSVDQLLVSQNQVVDLEATEIALNAATAEVFFMESAARTFTHDLMAYRGLVGQTIHLHLRGARGGDVWGTDIYTDDSDPNVAAVHDGILKPGEEGIAAIRLLPGIERYDGTTKNGVRTDDFGHFGGSYRFEGVQPVARPEPSERVNKKLFIHFVNGFVGDSASEELIKMRDQIGASIDLTVTGSSGAPIWGDGIYTDDSAVAVAAVHAGLLKVGEIGVVRATIMGPRDRYEGTSRNGIQSQSFDRFEGSYRLERVKP